MSQNFSKLTLSGWRQFNEIDIDFHDRLTIITGSNGSGKSTILNILRSHFTIDNEVSFLATPIKRGTSTYFSLGDWLEKEIFNIFRLKKREPEPTPEVGKLYYSDGRISSLTLPASSSMQYALARNSHNYIDGTFVGSHRAAPKYEEVKDVPVNGIRPSDALTDYVGLRSAYEKSTNYHKNGSWKRMSPLGAIKETLIGFVMVGIGNTYLEPVPELVGLFDSFQDILSRVLPQEIGFQKLEVRPPEVIVTTLSGSFPIDASSGGVVSIIHVAWQIFLASKTYSDGFVVIIDEPENHLHPSMQRKFLGSLVSVFPKAQFIVATHSPFIISSVKDSSVYALVPETITQSPLSSPDPRSVVSRQLDQIHRAGPATEILKDVLGVPVTMPEWSEKQLSEISDEFASQEVTKETLRQLRARLESVGLEEFYPDAVRGMIRD